MLVAANRDDWNVASRVVSCGGVWNFHPIHLFLNTEDLARYERTREWHNNVEVLRQYRFENTKQIGSFEVLKSIIYATKQDNIHIGKISDINLKGCCVMRIAILGRTQILYETMNHIQKLGMKLY